jgi:acyl-CoA synthetase (NDP forming)
MLNTIAHTFLRRGIGLHTLVASGHEVAVDFAEIGAAMLADARARAVAIYAESIRSMERFRAFAQRSAELGKPVILLLANRSEVTRSVTRSHTGAAITSRRVVEAIAEQYGVMLVADLDEMVWTVEALAACDYERCGQSGGIAVISSSGGATALFSEAAADAELNLPEPGPSARAVFAKYRPQSTLFNPFDLGYTLDDPDAYDAMIEAIAADERFDVVAEARGRLFEANGLPARVREQNAFAETVRAHGKIPFFACIPPLMAEEHVDHATLADAVVAYGSRESVLKLRALSRWAASAATAADATMELRAIAAATDPQQGDACVLTGSGVRALLSSLPMAWPAEVLVADENEVGDAVRQVGLPAVAKAEAGLAHRAVEGGVLIRLRTEDAVRAGVQLLKATFDAPVAISAWVPHEEELFVGFERSHTDGALMAFGPGGSRAGESVALRVLPATPAQLSGLADRFKGTDAQRDQILALMTALQELVTQNHEILAIDLNPLVFDQQGLLTILDAKAHL